LRVRTGKDRHGHHQIDKHALVIGAAPAMGAAVAQRSLVKASPSPCSSDALALPPNPQQTGAAQA
jgi:hypothetical protein